MGFVSFSTLAPGRARPIVIDSPRFYKLHSSEGHNLKRTFPRLLARLPGGQPHWAKTGHNLKRAISRLTARLPGKQPYRAEGGHNLKKVLVFLLLSVAAGQTLAEPTEFRAEYKAHYKGIPIGATGIRQLKRVEGNRYLLVSSARNFLAHVKEQSLFRWQPDGGVTPIEYQYHRGGLGKNRDAVLTFDWDKRQVLNDVQSKPWIMDIPDGAMDKLLYQFKLRSDLDRAYRQHSPWPVLTYHIADGGRMKVYRFKVLGADRTRTPIGTFDTIKATRIRDDDDDRTTVFWLAPDYEFMLVRFRQFDSDGDGFELLLKKAEFGGERLTSVGSLGSE